MQHNYPGFSSAAVTRAAFQGINIPTRSPFTSPGLSAAHCGWISCWRKLTPRSGIRTYDPLIERRESEPLHHDASLYSLHHKCLSQWIWNHHASLSQMTFICSCANTNWLIVLEGHLTTQTSTVLHQVLKGYDSGFCDIENADPGLFSPRAYVG